MSITTPSLIRRAAEQFSERIAVVFGDRRWTYRQVNERANRLANGLRRLGLTPTDRIGTIRNNCSEHVEIALALLKSGSVGVTLNPRLTAAELAWQLNNSGAKAVILGPEFVNVIEQVRSSIKHVEHFIVFGAKVPDMLFYEEIVTEGSPEEPELDWKADDIGSLIYTSGTTGLPKGIIQTRCSELAVARNLLLDVVADLTAADHFLALQPLYHGAGTFVLPCWLRGASHVIVPSFDPETAVEAIVKHHVTLIKTVPTVLIRLLAHPDLEKHDFSQVRSIIYGASPMPIDRLRHGMKVFGPVFVQVYGQSEAPMTITVLRKEEHVVEGAPKERARLRSVGRPFTLVQVRVVDEKGQDVQPGDIGEIIVTGDHVMQGYWKLPGELTAETLKDGWVYTRDMGTRDEDGFIYLLDRKSEMIITGGLNVYPNEVEQVLYAHPAVLEAAVIGVPDPVWVESVKACITLRAGKLATEAELIEFCRTRLGGFKSPRSVEFLPELPKSAAGKILRRELKQRHASAA